MICECCGQTIRAKRAKPAARPFRGYDDFAPAFAAAKAAAAADVGGMWALRTGCSVLATVPAAWVACKVYGRVSRGPRDLRMPAARYWPAGELPAGPIYSLDYPRELADDSAAETARRRHASAIKYARDMTRAITGWTVCGWSHRQIALSLTAAATCRAELAQAKRLTTYAAAA